MMPAKRARYVRMRWGSPQVVVPLVSGVALIGVLLGAADVGRVLRAASAFHSLYVLVLFALTLGYEALRAVQWFHVLRVLDRREPWRIAVMSYMGGELAKSLPGGLFPDLSLTPGAGCSNGPLRGRHHCHPVAESRG